MFPPQSNNTNLDLAALSGICGSISIVCWVVVFSPQIVENFRNGSAEGLSIVFIVIWLVGDIFNILGGVLQGVLPTMIILAVYYTLADIVLILQVFYYNGFTLKDEVRKPAVPDSERQPLLAAPSPGIDARTRSSFSEEFRRYGEHLSPATPLISDAARDPPAVKHNRPTSSLQTFVLNSTAVVLVCAAGVFGWWISNSYGKQHPHRHYDKHEPEPKEPLEFDRLGQFFGYLCAVFYLASRVPQIVLNYRRKSTDGVSLLFFLFACIGNLTYDMSIFAFDPEPNCQRGAGRCESGEARVIYSRYIAINASWIAGSLGTLILDAIIFVQFFLYRKDEDDSTTTVNGHAVPEQAVSD